MVVFEAIAAQTEDRTIRAKEAAECIQLGGISHPVSLYADVTPSAIRAIAWTGTTPPAYPAFPRTQGLNGAAVAEGCPVIINDVRKDPRYLTTFGATRAEAIVPIRAGGRIVGTVDVESEDVDAFTADDEHFLQDCAEALAALWSEHAA